MITLDCSEHIDDSYLGMLNEKLYQSYEEMPEKTKKDAEKEYMAI